MLVLGPNEFNTLAQADILYENLDTSTWATVGTTIEYEYDDNGSLIKKTTWDGDIDTGNIIEEREYVYNLQNRLAYIIDTKGTSGQEDDEILTEYRYNDEGVRVAKVDYTGANPNTTLYLIDSANHTGYAQVIAELTYDNSTDPNPATDTPAAIRSYTIGDDVIAQSDNPGTATDTEYLLYDGHGSIRQVTDYSIDSSNDIIDSYSYDAYGMMLGGNPTANTPAATNLLYTGEQFDTDLQQYYLRARYYDPSNGRFNRLDPYAGNNQDPQSLHKYLYCHANPVNAIDPSGKLGLITEFTVSTKIRIYLGLTLVVNGLLLMAYLDYRQSRLQYERQIAKEEAQKVTNPTTQTLEELEDRIEQRLRYCNGYVKLFYHYSFMKYSASIFVSGLWPPVYLTTERCPTGWIAKLRCALYKDGPRDAMYLVWPKRIPSFLGPAKKQIDQWEPTKGMTLPGGAPEYVLFEGAEPGDVVHVWPIPEGNLN